MICFLELNHSFVFLNGEIKITNKVGISIGEKN